MTNVTENKIDEVATQMAYNSVKSHCESEFATETRQPSHSQVTDKTVLSDNSTLN